MRITVRGVLLIAAIVLFLLALVIEDSAFELLALGLACFAGSQAVDDLVRATPERDGRAG